MYFLILELVKYFCHFVGLSGSDLLRERISDLREKGFCSLESENYENVFLVNRKWFRFDNFSILSNTRNEENIFPKKCFTPKIRTQRCAYLTCCIFVQLWLFHWLFAFVKTEMVRSELGCIHESFIYSWVVTVLYMNRIRFWVCGSKS